MNRRFLVCALTALVGSAAVHAATFNATGNSGFEQDLDPLDGFDYLTQLDGTWTASFSVPEQSGLTLVSNQQSQGGSFTRYNGVTVHRVTLATVSGQYNLVTSDIAGQISLWDRRSFGSGQHLITLRFTLGTTAIAIDFVATNGQHSAYGQMFTVNTPNPNTLDGDFWPLLSEPSDFTIYSSTTELEIDGSTPVMPGRGRYFGPMSTFIVPGFARGDMNCDGAVNFDDISGFVVAVVGRAAYEEQFPACDWLNGDTNRDKTVNFDDINGFVTCIIAGSCE